MQETLELLSDLTKDDITWMLERGTEQQVITGTLIMREGDELEAIVIVLNGMVGVEISALGDQLIAKLGPGELLGELSFIEGRPAAATIKAVENSLLLTLPHQLLESKLAQDSMFASRFYRACASMGSRRLRERVAGVYQEHKQESLPSGILTDDQAYMLSLVQSFKELLQRADKEALRNHNEIPTSLSNEIQQG